MLNTYAQVCPTCIVRGEPLGSFGTRNANVQTCLTLPESNTVYKPFDSFSKIIELKRARNHFILRILSMPVLAHSETIPRIAYAAIRGLLNNLLTA
jgi:hypothetical protein